MDPQLAKEIELLHDQVCHALGDTKRLLILYLLSQQPYNVSGLAAELKVPQPTVSRHLQILRERCLVETQREATSIYYSLSDRRLITSLDLLRDMLRDRVLAQAHTVEPHPAGDVTE